MRSLARDLARRFTRRPTREELSMQLARAAELLASKEAELERLRMENEDLRREVMRHQSADTEEAA